jgi:hypothetical protein
VVYGNQFHRLAVVDLERPLISTREVPLELASRDRGDLVRKLFDQALLELMLIHQDSSLHPRRPGALTSALQLLYTRSSVRATRSGRLAAVISFVLIFAGTFDIITAISYRLSREPKHQRE